MPVHNTNIFDDYTIHYYFHEYFTRRPLYIHRYFQRERCVVHLFIDNLQSSTQDLICVRERTVTRKRAA